ncbi:MAG: ParB/RepB/Spo0J family partition protein [Saprospiraceae bacterium]|nr:ParB/RepB/Spo0J family partition protein [Saprospiraceae bacterium]
MIEKKARKKEIGKGIRALLATVEQSPAVETRAEAQKELSSEINEIPLSQIEPNPFQPRQDWDPAELEELASSIKAMGIIQPVTLRALSAEVYQLISGERRFRASKLAGLESIPAYVRTAGDQEMLEMALVENIQRADLNAIEVAISYQRLIDECKLTHEGLSERVGKERSTITNYTRLLKLPPDIQHALRKGQISMGHARSLAGSTDLLKQRAAFRETVNKGWSVRQLEQFLKGKEVSAPGQKSSTPGMSAAMRDIERRLASHFGSRVQLEGQEGGKGKITISYGDDEDLNRILELLDI